MTRKSVHVLAAALAFCAATASAQNAPAPFADGDRWCAVGDSITHGGSYHSLVWLYYLTRFPERTIDLSNAGISGDTAAGGLRRVAWDVLPNRPTVASVMFGMNDVGRTLYDGPATPDLLDKRRQRLTAYQESQRALVQRLREHGTRVILVTPSMFDQTADLERPKQTGVNDALADCGVFLERLAGETGATLVDLHRPMTQLNAERQRRDPKLTIVGADRVHPGPPGHLLMAYLFLRAQRVPADVARLTIDARRRRVVAAVNGRAGDLRRSQRELTFTWTENALPFPVPQPAAAALDWVPFTQELNQEVLQVTGLAPGRYALRIDDGEPLGPYAADELARGINLALEPSTPQYRQALAVAELVEKRRALIAEKLRGPALVEHRYAPEGSHPVTLEIMKPVIAEQLALFKTQPTAPTFQRAVEAYLELKPQQADVVAAAARLAEEARRAARVTPHKWRVTPVE